MNIYAPDKPDPNLHKFISILLTQKIKPASGLTPSSFEKNRQLLEVPVKSDSGYPANYCWFNCLEHSLNYGGSVVFGWGIWQRDTNHFVAQHHAVWLSPSGEHIDVTKNEISDKVFFIPDNCAPFDFHKLRCPFSFELNNSDSGVWFGSDNVESPIFAVAMLDEPTNSEATHINKIRQLAIERKLI